MDLKLGGKKVVITGGSRGIGFACAELFAEEGCQVTVVGSNEASVAHAALRLRAVYSATIDALCVDLGHPDGVGRLAKTLRESDIVVNNAGSIPGGGLDTVDDSTWRASWDLKVFGYINASREALPAMIDRGRGVIINIIGIAGASPRYDYLCGSMANSALITFTRAAGAYAANKGVRVVGINPGPTETDRLVSLYKSRAQQRFGDESKWQEMLVHLPFGRPAKPGEIADLVVFAASARASYLSGVVIDADGGAMYSDR
ncbi:short-chain dehydrogenase/reductase [Paraburkholderia sediminicola]|uniref:short-chain dehydrogenase/reductase n=1 Tax=Paraburkholderia sediminicola TaxID=458836 RepID=UPI0038B6DEA0